MKTINQIMNFRLIALVFTAITITSCGNDDDAAPPKENLPEVFTDVTLIFTPESGEAITITATDPDGEGDEELMVPTEGITLSANTTYTLTFNIENKLDPNADLNAEILDESDEHQFFFGFTEDVFASPMGSGNITAADMINYADMDENMLPVGLETTWTTGAATTDPATFTARLQHQPELKNAESGAETGDSDFDLEFALTIE